MYSDRITLNPHGRIDSWKAIAAFLNRDERTVQRWEKDRALPVHRLHGHHVFAYRNELLLWQHSGACPAWPRGWSQTAGSVTPPDATSTQTTAQRASLVGLQPARERGTALESTDGSRARWIFWLAACALAAFLFLADSLYAHMHISARGEGLVQTVAAAAAVSPHAEASVSPQDAVAARELYLRGNYYRNRRTGEALGHAVEEFTQAILHDPGYAQAYAGLAATYELLPEYSASPAAQAFPRALLAARRAVALEPNCAEAHRVLAFALLYWSWRVPESLHEFERALQLDASDAETHHWYATALFTVRRTAEAQREIARARELNPSSRAILADQVLIDFFAGSPRTGCLQRLGELQRSEPDFASPPRYAADILFTSNDLHGWAQAEEAMAKVLPSSENRLLARAARRGWARGGGPGALAAVRAVQQRLFTSGESSGYDLALLCIHQGDRNAAVRYLQAAFDANDYRVLSLMHAPEAASLRGYPPFEALRSAVEQRAGTSAQPV